MQPTITGIVLTGNSMRLLDRCLDSLSFCSHLLVVDSLSTDSSVDIAKKHGAKVLSRAWTGIGDQFLYAFEHVESDWIIILDSDEVCTNALREEVIAAINSPQTETSPKGYFIPRRSWYFNRFIMHSGWRPDRLYRLFKNREVDMRMSGAHQTFHPTGIAGTLEHDIIHYPYCSFANHFEKLNDYAERGAQGLLAKGKTGGLLKGIAHGLWRFFRLYILKRGFLDGRAGFILAAHGAFYAFLKYVRMLKSSWGAPYDHQ